MKARDLWPFGVGIGLLWALGPRRTAAAVDAPARNRDEGRSIVVDPPQPDPLGEFSSTPRPGWFYQLEPRDTPLGIARAVLEHVQRNSRIPIRVTGAHCLDYWHTVSSGRYNLRTYGSPSTSRRFPARLLVPGAGLGLRPAFLPRHADARACFAAGRLPPRTVDQQGASIGGGDCLGALWLPPVDDQALAHGEVSCAALSWADGSSTIDPDPDFLGRMTR